jgi:hypothetical protein
MARKLEPHDFRCVKTPVNNAGFSYAEVQKYMSELYEFYWVNDPILKSILNEIARQEPEPSKQSMENLLGEKEPLDNNIDKMCEYYLLAKYGEYDEDYGNISHPVSMHNLMLVHDGWAMGRILTVSDKSVVPKYDEGKGKLKNEDGTFGDIITKRKINDYDGYVFGDDKETVISDKGIEQEFDSKEMFEFKFGDNLVKLEGRRVNQMIDFMQLSDRQQGLDVKFIHKFQAFMKTDRGLNFLDNVQKENGDLTFEKVVRDKEAKKKYIQGLLKGVTKIPVKKCNWPFTPQCYYYPNWRKDGKTDHPLQITVSTTLIVHKSLPTPYQPPVTAGGAPRRRAAAKRTAKDKKKKSGAAAPASGSPWQSTGRKVTAKDGRKKLVYRNAATGELRVRRVSVNERTGKRVTRYVNF